MKHSHNSEYIKKQHDYINKFDSDISLMSAWIDDTLTPSLSILKMKTILYDMLEQAEKVSESKKEGQSYKNSLKRIFDMLELCYGIDKIATQNNTMQLIARHSLIKAKNLEAENKKLKEELNSIKLAWEQQD